MALIKSEDKILPCSWNIKASNKPRLKLPEITDRPTIDYQKLRWLCEENDSIDRNDAEAKKQFHQLFMENYSNLFVKPPKKLGFPVHSANRGKLKTSLENISQKATGPTTESEKKAILNAPKDKEFSHDIKDYLQVYHKQRRTDKAKIYNPENTKVLRKLLRKLPFERTAADNDKILSVLKTVPYFKENVPANVLKELCVVSQLETWKEVDFSVFGNTGLHLILKGSVVTNSAPYLIVDKTHCNESDRSSDNDEDEDDIIINTSDTKLGVGECFGTLKKLDNKESISKYLAAKTLEANCEFLKITTSDYSRVIEQIKQKEHTEKLNLILSCDQYSSWPRQPLLQVANLIEWTSYPPNTVLVSEGYKSPFIAFIKSGECHVLRQVDVLETLKNGQKERRNRQVVIGRLGPSKSFAELSVLLKETMYTSVVTASKVELGIIKPERIEELDDVTVQLFKQSNKHLFGHLTKENVQDEYMQQELKREWNEYKHHVIVDVINTRGIKPGYGKWAK